MNIVCILPSIYSSNSNGVNTLFRIYLALHQASPLNTIFLAKPHNSISSDAFKSLFGDNLQIYSEHDKSVCLDSICKSKFALVRPDDLEGVLNDIHWELAASENCESIVNVLLAPPFAFANKVSPLNYYGKKDFFLLANQALMPSFDGMESFDVFLESALDQILLGLSILEFCDRTSL